MLLLVGLDFAFTHWRHSYILFAGNWFADWVLLPESTGNGGTASGIPKVSNVALSRFPELVDFAVKNEIGLVVPGPEAPLVEGIEECFRKGAICLHAIFRSVEEI